MQRDMLGLTLRELVQGLESGSVATGSSTAVSTGQL